MDLTVQASTTSADKSPRLNDIVTKTKSSPTIRNNNYYDDDVHDDYDNDDDLNTSSYVLDLSPPIPKDLGKSQYEATSENENVSSNDNSNSMSVSVESASVSNSFSEEGSTEAVAKSRTKIFSIFSSPGKLNPKVETKNKFFEYDYKDILLEATMNDNEPYVSRSLADSADNADHFFINSSSIKKELRNDGDFNENEIESHKCSAEDISISSCGAVMVIKSNLGGGDVDDEAFIFTPNNTRIYSEYSTHLEQDNRASVIGIRRSSGKRKTRRPIKMAETNLFEDPSKSFMCSVCGKVFTKKCNLQDHLRIHTGEKPFKCGVCFKRFTVNSSLQVHLRTHTGEKPFQCPQCGKLFTVSSSLNAHIKIHTGDRKYQCPDCHKTFVKNGDLKNHMTSHTGEKKYQCEVCFKRFSKMGSLTLHKKLHLGEVHKCPDPKCDKEFPTNSYLQMHMKYHSGQKPFKCAVCEKSYRVKGDLQIHMRNHSGEKPFKCDVCFKAFTRNDTLILHMRTHTGEKPYECPICGKRFSVNCALHRHIRTHTGIKPYVCVVCAKAFDSSSNRQKHMKTHQRDKELLQSVSFPNGIFELNTATFQSVVTDQHQDEMLTHDVEIQQLSEEMPHHIIDNQQDENILKQEFEIHQIDNKKAQSVLV